VGAARVAHGAVPYRDFWSAYPPAGFYTLAGILRLFGYSILVERVWRAVVRWAVCLVVLAIGRRLISSTASYLASLLTALVLHTNGTYGFGFVPEALFWSLLAVLLLLRSFHDRSSSVVLSEAKHVRSFGFLPRLGSVFFAGAASGMVALYRHDLGVYTLVSTALALLLLAGGELRNFRSAGLESGRQASSPGRLRAAARFVGRVFAQTHRGLSVYAGGAAVIIMPALLSLLHAVPITDLRTDFFVFPRIQVQARGAHVPPILPQLSFLTHDHMAAYGWLLFYAPLAVYALSWAGLGRWLVNGRQERFESILDKSGFGWLLLTVLGSFFVIRAVVGLSEAMTVPATILVPLVLVNWRAENWPAGSTNLVKVFLLLLTVSYAGAQIGLSRYLVAALARHAREQTSSLPEARGFYLDHDEEAAVRYVRQCVPEDAAIFVGNAQHRQVFNNDALFYFLAGRRPATRFHDLNPGLVTTATVQREMIRDLERNQVSYIVLDADPAQANRDFQPPSASGASLLDDFLRQQYRQARTFGFYSVCKKT